MALFGKTLISLIFILVTLNSFGQKKDSVIKNIRQLYKDINTDNQLKKVELYEEEFLGNVTDGGGSLTGYFKGGEILKIHLWIGISYGVKQFEYYFNNGNLFFVYEKEEDFGFTKDNASSDDHSLRLAFEGRYYIDNGKLIEQKIKGKKLQDPSDLKIKETLKDLTSYKKLLHKRFLKGK